MARAAVMARLHAERADEVEERSETPLKPNQCRAYMRRELAREFRGIVKGFVAGAKRGSCQHVKLAAELLETPKRAPRRGKGSAQKMVDELRRQGRL